MATLPDTAGPIRHDPRTTLLGLLTGLLAAMLAGLLLGSVQIGIGDLWHMVAIRTGLSDDPERLTDSVLWAIRLPRVLAASVVGAGMGIAGATLQGTLRNRLADPHLVGMAPAAGLGAVAGIALSPSGSNPLLVMVGAALGALAFAVVVRRIAANTVGSGQLVLVGLALGLGLLAVLGAVVLAWDSPRVPTFNFWIFGGLSGTTWTTLGAGALFVAIGTGVSLGLSRRLDILALGEDEAGHLGVDVRRLVLAALVGAGLIVGGAVGLGGVIGFVGLVAPAVIRSWVGPTHRSLLPLSAVAGALMLVVIDTAARTLAAPVEIPVGLLTAIVGAPVLVWFIVRRQQ